MTINIKQDQLLQVNKLEVYIPSKNDRVKIVNNISFSIGKGEFVGLVGESGSGKSVSALSIMRLNTSGIKYSEHSEILFNGKNLLKMNEKEMRKIRGNDIAMVFQDPKFSLNPVHKIGRQITEAILLHKKVSKKEAMKQAADLLSKVGIPDPERCLNSYPHHLSGGLRQRVMISMALACEPSLIIADEPTTALDVTIQAQILDLLKELQEKEGISILFITHDLGVVAEISNRVLVMYSGEIVEKGLVKEIFKTPLHPYTRGLLGSIPKLEGPSDETLYTIPGMAPNIFEVRKGCRFASRCEFATDKCVQETPVLEQDSSGTYVSCWHPLKERGVVNGEDSAT